MASISTEGPDSWRSTKRWYKKYPELQPPGRLPVAPFISEEQYALEQEKLWPNVWLMACREADIPNPGDFLIKEIPPCNASLIVVRGKDGVVRTFHNVCPHRGSLICWQENGTRGSTAAFRCPYHDFTYDLDGRLIFVPDEENFYDLDKSTLGLKAVMTDIWNGFVFVHLNPKPRESLRDYLGDVVTPLEDFPFEERQYYFEYTAEIKANWKILVASFLEGYHGHTFHAGNIDRSPWVDNPYSHTFLIKLFEKHRFISLGRSPDMNPTKMEQVAVSRMKKSGYDEIWSSGIPNATEVNSRDDRELFTDIYSSFVIHNIFPNLQLNTVGGLWYYYQFWPLSVDRVIWQGRIYYPEPRTASDRFLVEFHKIKDRDILMEDGHVSENQHPIMKAGTIDTWLLQDEEIAIQHFNKVIDDYTKLDRGIDTDNAK